MEKFSFRFAPAKTSESMFILVQGESADEDGVVDTRSGFIKVEPEKAESLMAKLKSGERTVRFGDQIPDSPNFVVNVLKANTPAAVGAGQNELQHS